MALGSSWGTREEMLHPRDRRGRFRKKWKMPDGVINKLQAFLERFNPRTFQSDQQASQYLFNKAKPGRFPGDDQKRLHMDWDEANDHIRAGDIDPSTQRFIQMMERATVDMPEQMILHRSVGAEAFGLTPDQLGLEDGGLEDFTGRLIADRAFSATNIGTPMGTGPGRIHMTIATPRGQKAVIPASTPNDRRVFLPMEQPYRVTKVEPDGQGGWHMMVIAEPAGVARKTPEPVMPGRRGAGLSEAQREARITPSMSPEQRMQVAQDNAREMETGANAPTPVPAQAPAPAAPAPTSPSAVQGPTSPATGVPERQEAVLKEQVGPTATQGASPAEVAQAGEEAARQAAEAQSAPAPATPESFRQAFQEADLKAPSRGPQQKEYNDALGGIVSGKTSPQEALRQLDTDIEVNKRKLERQKAGTEKADPELEQNIQDQEALADLISSHTGAARRGQEAPAAEAPTPAPAAPAKRATKAAPKATKAPAKKAGPTATPGAPSTSKEATPKAPEPAPDRRTKAELLKEAGPAGRARMTKDQLKKVIADRDSGALAPAPEVPVARKADGTAVLTPDQQRRVNDRADRIRARKTEDQYDDEDRRIIGLSDNGPAAAAPAKKATPAKAVAKKATPAKAAPSPVDDEEEAFKARVAEAGLPDKVADLRSMARDQKIRGFSTMNKKQLQSALMGDEVPRAGKIGVVPPAKMVPHLEAADSDQAARALLANHTLVDLKALAKHREIKLPSRGATKPRLTDMILTDIRGDQEGIQGRTPDTGLEEDLGNLGYITLAGPAGDAIDREIAQAVPDDPESLRRHRDNLEALSKQFRADRNNDAANMAQAAADAMGMRAQTISGVEEVAPPVKRVAKKAVPEVDADAPEVERPLEKMLKPELLALAQREGASAVRPTWTKPRILDEIKRNRRMDSSRGEETEDERARRELGALPGGAERLQGPAAGPLRLPDRAPTPEEIARDNPETPAPAKKATKRAAKKAVANVEQVAGDLATQVRGTEDGSGGTFGDMLQRATPDEVEELREEIRKQGLEPKGNTAEELFDNSVKDMLANRMRELGMLPEDPAKPTRAQKRVPKGSVPGRAVTTPDRKQSFREGWDGQKFIATGAAGRSMDEVRDDIESGKITPEEGVRRLDSDISFNEDEISDIQAELEGMEPDDREASDLNLRGAQLEESVRSQKKAKAFIRAHFKDEAPVTRQEVEIALDPDEMAAFQRVQAAGPEGIADLKRAAKEEGLGTIKGTTLDEVVQNIGRAVAAREIKNRGPEAPPPAKKAAKFLPPLKDGTQRKSMTNVEVGDVVKRGSSKDEFKRVVRIEPPSARGGNVVLHFEDGSKVAGKPQTTVWMGSEDGIRAGRPPAKKVAKAAVPAKATPPPVVDLDQPTRHNAEVIGTGLDLDAKGEDKLWLAAVQSELDAGVDGRQIANNLRRDADASRAGAVLRLGDWVDDREPGPPEIEAGRARRRAERQAERDKLNARVDRMELMADRLEGVRPIKKAAPAAAPAKATGAPEKREMGTMQAAQAQSKALFDLRNGKSHAEVATALRQAATGVGSREHDPQTVRPLEFTPSERTAMKRADAKRLRDLAAEIQAQGVAQRAEARAAKKAAKAAPESHLRPDRGAAILSDDPQIRAQAAKAFEDRGPERRLLGNPPAPKKRTAAEMRRAQTAAEMNGISVEEQLQRFDQQKEERKNLTGPVGELILAQLDDAMRRLQEADSPAAERSALAGLLRPEIAQLATRLGLKTDRAKSVMVNAIIDRVKGREAPTISAERAVPKVEAPGAGASDGLDDLPEIQLRRLAVANGVEQTLTQRQDLVRQLRDKGVRAPVDTRGSLAAQRAAQDAAPVKWSYGTRELSSGLEDWSAGDRKEATRVLFDWALHSSGSSEPPINKQLRSGSPDLRAESDALILDRIMESSPLPHAITVYRGYQNGTRVLPKDFRRDLTGHRWTDPGYTATTHSEYGAQIYAGDEENGGFYARISLPKGFPAIAIQDALDGLDDEGEIVLPRGLEFVVIRDHEMNEDGIRELDIEVRPTR